MQALFLSACVKQTLIGEEVTPPQDYCSTVTAYSSPITVSGTAYYGFRQDGYLDVSDGGLKFEPTVTVVGTLYTITLNGTAYNYTAVGGDTEKTITQHLVDLINANASAPVVASQLRIYVSSNNYNYFVLLNEKNYGVSLASHSKSATLTETSRSAPNPIRYAEVMIKDANGSIIQCGQTNGAGAYSVQLPQAASGTYTVQVNSRILNSTKARIYVLDHFDSNNHYSISRSVSATATSSNNNLVAPGAGTLQGGAFNILDQIIKANEYVATKTTPARGCGTTFANCVPFTAAPLVYVYWKPGVNPYTYFGSTSPSSFYTGDGRLFILGGSNGDTDNSDCDHYDDSVIVHEYGHFLEDMYAVSESPGGYHNGNGIIDPRLAWSEGWADFFQGAVEGWSKYRDSRGNVSGASGSGFIIDEDIDTGNWDQPSGGGEGIFREFSITRLLYDAIDTNNEAGDSVTAEFSEIWTAFAGTNGLKLATHPFRNMGYILSVQSALGGSDWSSIRASEKQNDNAAYNNVGFREYATPLDASGAACAGGNTVTMTPVTDDLTTDESTLTNSDQYHNNDFFSFYHTGGPLNVKLLYSTANKANPPDLDLYLYSSNYVFGTSPLAKSINPRPSACVATPGNCTNVLEQVSASLPAGYYMIDVMAYSAPQPGGVANYTLTVNNTLACPQP